MRELHYDLAGAPVPQLFQALLQVADEDHLHYGSDYPFTPPAACERLLQELEATALLSEAARQGMFGANAMKLFARLHEGLAS